MHVTGQVPASQATGYRADTARAFGPWGDKPITDLPYTLYVIPADLIENAMLRGPDALARINPLTGIDVFETSGVSFNGSRGVGNTTIAVNGIRNDNGRLGVYTENLDSLQVMSGLSGFLYGFGNVGGTQNYILKRPTAEPLRKVTLGNYGGGSYFAHADVGGSALDGALGYRVNLVRQDGRTAYEGQRVDKTFGSIALDFNASERLRFAADLSYGEYEMKGLQASFGLWNVNVPSLPKPLDGKHLWSPQGTFLKVDSLDAGLSMHYDINDALTLRAALSHREDRKKTLYTCCNNLIYTQGELTGFDASIYAYGDEHTSDGYYVYLDSRFQTLGIRHKLTIGSNGYYHTADNPIFEYPDGSRTSVYNDRMVIGSTHVFAWGDPRSIRRLPVSDPFALIVDKVRWTQTANYNFMIGDDITINDRWSVLAGLNHSRIDNQGYNSNTGVKTAKNDGSALTPTLSVLYKPTPTTTTYVSYMESLEPGVIVGPTYKNAGDTLKPLKSRQYEFGIKSMLDDLLLTAALYQLERASQYSDDGTIYGTFVQDGLTVNRGLEITLAGKATKRLSLTGGFNFIDSRLATTNNPATYGKEPAGVPDIIAKIYGEYELPSLPGLVLTGGVYYNGSSYMNYLNTNRFPGYANVDLGARYVTRIGGYPTVFRLSVSNVTNDERWVYANANPPRAVSFSLTTSF